MFSLPIIIPNIIDIINQKQKILVITDVIWAFVYFSLEIAFVEEIVFRGFIQSRIQGLIRSKWLSIIIVGFMFSLSHIPFQMTKVGMSLNQYITGDLSDLVINLVFHIYFVYIYTR